MTVIAVLQTAPAVGVLSVGLVMLIRRRAALGARASTAIAAVVMLLGGALARLLLGAYVFGAFSPFGVPWWVQLVDLLLLPVDLLGLPVLAWVILAGRSPRPAKVIS